MDPSSGGFVEMWHQLAKLGASWMSLENLKDAVRSFKQLHSRSQTEPVAQFLTRLPSVGEPYCLLLRAFGLDGGHRFYAKYLKFVDWGAHSKDSVAARLWQVDPPIERLEQALPYVVAQRFQLETATLISPNAFLVPQGPTYLHADNDTWESDVQKLVERSAIIVMQVHTDRGITSAMERELELVLTDRHLNKVVLLLPCPTSYRYLSAMQGLARVSKYIPAIAEFADRVPVAIAFHSAAHPIAWEMNIDRRRAAHDYLDSPREYALLWAGYTHVLLNALDYVGRARSLRTFGSALSPFRYPIISLADLQRRGK